MGTRQRNGSLEVSTDIYTNGDRVIAIAGVCHIAEQSFWKNLTKRIAGYESMGYAVQYEMIRNASAKKGEKKSTAGLYGKIAEVSGLQSQNDGLEYKDHWANTDMDVSEMKQAGLSMDSLFSSMEKASASIDKIIEDGGAEKMSRHVRWGLRWMSTLRKVIPVPKEHQSVILDARNEVAVKALLDEEKSVVSIWGAAHLQGIGEALKQKGFKLESRLWSVAVARYRQEEPVTV